ncbi:hypothetical protein Tco_0291013, partial [Tanacetum coccineum]
EATKDSLKRFGEGLQTKTSKRLKSDEAKYDESTKKTGKRRKQIARKGLHTDLNKDDSKDSDKASKKDDSTSGTKIPINPVPVAMKSPSIANYKIIQQGRKGVYQIVRENGTDKVYISFGAMLTDISRDDLTELYRIVMRKHGMNEPEDEFEKGQQRLNCWRYYEACKVHCLNLESVDIYMLIERKYPLSAEVCKAMLDKKLQGGKPDEDCYKMLKMMEKQAGIRKHKDWLVQEQTALGKDFSNPLMADNLPKIVWLSTHHIWHMIHRMYVDGGSSTDVLYEHGFNCLRPKIKSQMVLATTSLTSFSKETIWPLGQLRLLVTIGDAEHSTKAWMNFMIVRSLSPYNGIIGRPGIREIQAVPSTAHGMLKFLVDGGIVTIRSTILIPTECATVTTLSKEILKEAEVCHKNFKVALHPNFPD